MNVCFICEGSYPYVLGGVSSWIQLLITSMPDIQFSILAIGATETQRGQFKYAIPSNVVRIEEVFLDPSQIEKAQWGRHYNLKPREKEALKNLISGAECDWDSIFGLMLDGRITNVSELLLSKDFFDVSEEVCEKSFFYVPFTNFYWNVRSMMLPLFQILRSPYPEADLYHSVSAGYAGIFGAYLQYRTRKPYIITEHGLYSREREEEIIKANWLKSYCKNMWINFFYSLSKKTYDSADKVLTLFSRNKEIQMEMGCPEGKISIIPNGVDLDSFPAGSSRDDDMINIGAIVRVVPIKDIFTLLYSFAFAKGRNPKLKLFVMGPTEEDREYYDECLQLVKNMGLQDVVFTGTVRIADVMGRMDIIVLTSISEGQPFAVLEAMSARKPCVTTDVGSCRELLEGYCAGIDTAGIICPVMDYESIGRAVHRLSVDEPLRRRMGDAGYQRVKTAYTRELMVTGYRNLYSAFGV